MNRGLFMIGLWLVCIVNSHAPQPLNKTVSVEMLNQRRQEEIFNEVMQSIKFSEGCLSEAYFCPSGQKTIGYGHRITKKEYFIKLTYEQIDSLLLNDFLIALRSTPEDIAYTKRLAIASFIYNVGIGNYNKSTLKKLVSSGEPIDNEITKWQFYKKNGRMVPSKALLNRRLYELKLYNNENNRHQNKCKR